ncbi:MAG TPA: hypothetical protein PKI19_03775 [Elusimicrobiales bacterium]|nr:hypothetical protein [Elusimicrobiales bacterium]
MGSQFLERNKRKSALALLLLLFTGRGKFVAVLMVAGLVSLPFLVSEERINSIMSFPAVAAALHAVGLDAASQAPAPDMLAAANLRAADGGAKASFWERFLRAANAPLPPAGTTSTMAMLRGGKDLLGPAVIKDQPGTKAAGPNNVKGSVNAEDRARGEGADGVNLAGGPGSGGADGVYGDLMGENLGDRMGGAAGPFANRAVLGGPGGAANRTNGVYNQVMNQAAENVPAPGAPKNLKSKMGRVSGFAWKSMGRKTARSSNSGLFRSGNRGGMFQLTRTFTAANMAFRSHSPEYAEVTGGAPYDGNTVEMDSLSVGDVIVPAVPDNAFAEGLMGTLDGLLTYDTRCTEVQAAYAEKVQALAEKNEAMKDRVQDPPDCCSSDSTINNWNNDAETMKQLCLKADAAQTDCDNAKCSTGYNGTPIDLNCGQYDDMKLDCGFGECFWGWVLAIVIIVLTVAAAILAWFPPIGTIIAAVCAVVVLALSLTDNPGSRMIGSWFS